MNVQKFGHFHKGGLKSILRKQIPLFHETAITSWFHQYWKDHHYEYLSILVIFLNLKKYRNAGNKLNLQKDHHLDRPLNEIMCLTHNRTDHQT